MWGGLYWIRFVASVGPFKVKHTILAPLYLLNSLWDLKITNSFYDESMYSVYVWSRSV